MLNLTFLNTAITNAQQIGPVEGNSAITLTLSPHVGYRQSVYCVCLNNFFYV